METQGQKDNTDGSEIANADIITKTSPSAEISTKNQRRSCNILVAHGGDPGAGFATLIYCYPINFILYSQKYNFTLWLDYNPKFNDLYFDKERGPNAFEYYFDEIAPDWSVCDRESSKFKVLKKGEINPQIHKIESGSIHLWYYHFKAQKIRMSVDEYHAEWYYDQRYRGAQIVAKWFHLRAEIVSERERIWREAKMAKYEVLGVQMRGSDKVQSWSIRRTVLPQEYMPYIAAFISHFGHKAKIFFETDDKNY